MLHNGLYDIVREPMPIMSRLGNQCALLFTFETASTLFIDGLQLQSP